MTDTTEEDRQAFILEASRAVDEYREWTATQEPDWGPLHDALPIEHCNGFMWMARVPWQGEVVEVYKHGITRGPLCLDHSGHAYVLTKNDELERVPVDDATDFAFRGIEELGLTRSSPYTEEYRREKFRKAREQGWTIVA